MTYVVGVAGGTGSGKSTIAQRIVEALGPEVVLVLQHDNYYRDRPQISYDERGTLNFDHPDALETSLLVRHLEALRRGEAIEVPAYDFTTHRRLAETTRAEPTAIVVVEGILVFAEPALRALLDLKLFVDTPSDIRAFRRIRRDLEHRGRDFTSIRDQYYATVRPMHLQFVEPSKAYADLIIPEGGRNRVALDLILAKLRLAAAPQAPEAG